MKNHLQYFGHLKHNEDFTIQANILLKWIGADTKNVPRKFCDRQWLWICMYMNSVMLSRNVNKDFNTNVNPNEEEKDAKCIDDNNEKKIYTYKYLPTQIFDRNEFYFLLT